MQKFFPIINIFYLSAVCIFLFIPPVFSQSRDPLVLQKVIPLENVEGRIDHLDFDPQNNRLFVAALGNDSLEVIDLNIGKRIRSIKGFSEPQGVVFVSEFKKIYISNGGSDQVSVLNSETFEIVRQIKLEDNADNIRYDSKQKKIYVGCGKALFIIDASKDRVVGKITLEAHPEGFEVEQVGLNIFVNVPITRKIVVIDRDAQQIRNQWPIEDGCRNFPMALDEGSKRLFIGCRERLKLLVLNAITGSTISQLDIGKDADNVFYDPASKNIYVSLGEGAIGVYNRNKDQYKFVKNIPTAPGARTSFFDSGSKRLFLAVPHRGQQPAEIRIYQEK